MSNTAVGQLYKRIIDAVIESSRTDFEENGIDNKTLLMLQETWQNRLSASQRAQFPWDPQPTPTAAPSTASSARHVNHDVAPAMQHTAQAMSTQNEGVTIKQEPRYDAPFAALPQSSNYPPGGLNPQYAQQRAAQLLQQQFGNHANNSIAALQSSALAMPGGQQQRSPNLQLPGQPQNTYQAHMQLQQPKEEPKDFVGIPQTDGAGEAAEEWDAVVLARNSRGEHEPMGRVHVDRIIRQQVEQIGRRLEAGGLLIPLDERKRTRRTKRSSKLAIPSDPGMTAAEGAPEAEGLVADVLSSHIAQFDGAESEDGLDGVDDEDAINSDLDDSDDGGEAGIESTMEGDVILCLYDKVQRVKNKWKCTLKDGVVTVNGKDYVFHKAQGEFEW